MPRRAPRTALSLTSLLALVAGSLAMGFTAPASASVSSAISSFPYTQDWSGLTTTSTWADFPGVEGFSTGTTIAAANQPNTTNVGNLTAEGTLTSQLLNQASTSLPNTVSTGGVLGFGAVPAADRTVALSATGTVTTPLLVFHLNTTGKAGLDMAYDVQDLDSGTDDQPTRVALQYRVGTSGAYTNIPAAYLNDATAVSNTTVTSTRVSVALPADVDNKADVFLRVITLDNASGSNEHIGIDNISITETSGPLTVTDPGDKSFFADTPISGFTVRVGGGTRPYTLSVEGLPAGLAMSSTGVISGKPTATGSFPVTVTATDAASTVASTTFDIVVSAPDPLVATNPGDKTAYVNQTMPSFTMASTGGAPAYSWSATGLPAGVTMSSAGVVSGTPTATGTFAVTATVTDGGSRTSQTSFTLTVSAVPTRTIAEIQGTGAASPYVDDYATTEGVVTAVYGSGRYGSGSSTHLTELAGFYLQTGGTPDTPGASDAVFVFMGTKTSPAIGDSVRVTGKVTEYFGLTEISPAKPADVVALPTALPAIVPGADLPGTTCAVGECATGAELAALREAHEGEAFQPTGHYTVSDSYDGSAWAQSGSLGFAMQGEIGLAANSDDPLVIGTEEIPASDAAALAEHNAWNEAHRVTLDDGADVDYSASSVEDVAGFPWLTTTSSPRVGAKVTFAQPLIFTFRFDMWRLDTRTRVAPGTAGTAQGVAFQDTRALNAAPDDVLGSDGNLKIATFNMLNYFTVTGEQYKASPSFNPNPVDATQPRLTRNCTYYTDRSGDRVSNNECGEYDSKGNLLWPGPRGAAQKSGGTDLSALTADFERQQAKEIKAINTMDADVMSLEEVENSSKIIDGRDRDAAVSHLVDVLNADWAASHPGDDNRWAFVPSPRPAAQPSLLEQDAIRSAFIYNPDTVETIGRSRILVNSAPFRNAREPLAQAFVRKGGSNADGFAVIVNHFKSKGGPSVTPTVPLGDNDDIGNGAGFYNGDRVRQAKALVAFANDFLDDKQIEAAFLTGDYNAYSQEDPVKTIVAAGYEDLHPANGQKTYSFGGLSGSLDHVFANEAARGWVTGKDVWEINSNESVYYEYSRYNANLTNLYAPNQFRASDHNPEIIGINAPKTPASGEVDTIQVLASNDFHGRLLDDPASASAGAAAMAGAVKQLRAANPDTAFVMAGDIVGASTFESFIQNDKPTIDAMNEAGLEVSAAGNHEFDQGYDDLMNRIMSKDDAEGGASWPYIAANVRDADTGAYALKSDRTDGNYAHANGATWWKDFPDLNGGQGISVGFVGAVTEDLDSLVAPSSIQGLEITSIVDEVNAAADQLKADGCGGEPCDLVIELVHEGAPSPNCATIGSDTTSTFGRIAHGANANVDAIISGHTHLKYNCKVAVAGKTIDRPVVSAGQYGSYLNQLEFEFTPGTKQLARIRQHVLAMKDYDEDAATKAIVQSAVDVAAVKGAQVLGQVTGPFKRARRVDENGATVENRGGESTLGNQVAEIQAWKTGADIGVMNPGGLRADLIGTDEGPGPVTYREAADVQPFANTLVTVDLTGAQLKVLLEQQWQRDPDGNVPSRPFLRLGTSKGFTWTEDSSRAEGDRITGMWLDGTAIDPTHTYTVSANSFLATGGDNFRALTLGTNVQDTGFTDLQATVDYLAAHPSLSVDHAQHAVGARVPAGPFSAGETVTIPVDSLSMTGEGDKVDTTVAVSMGARPLGTFPVTTALPSTPYDVPGAGTVSFTLPAGLTGPTELVTLTGGTTGTVATLEVPVTDTRVSSTVSGSAADIVWGDAGSVSVTVEPGTATGTVELRDGTDKIGEGTLGGDATTITIPAEALSVGTHTLTLKYLGDDNTKPSQGSVSVTVTKAASSVSGTAADIVWGDAGSVSVTVTPSAATGTVQLYAGATKMDEATLTSGAATLTIPAKSLPVGDHELTLEYLGDANHVADEGTVTVNVVKASTTVSGTAEDITWTRSGSVSVTVTPADAGGAVELFDGATKLGEGPVSNGASSIDIKPQALAVGTHSLTLKLEGDSSHGDSQGSVTVTVVKESTSVSGTAADLTWGNAGSVSVVVAPVAAARTLVPPAPTGTVELYSGATKLGQGTLSGGSASIAMAARALGAGDHSLTLKYLGDGSYTASQSVVSVRVLKAPTTVSAPDVTLQWAKASSVAITVTPASGGTVELHEGTTKLGAASLLGDGTARIALPARSLEVGTHTLRVTYLGAGNYAPSQSTMTVTVEKGRSTVEVAVPASVDAGDKAKIKASVSSVAGDAAGKVVVLVKEVGGSWEKEVTERLGDDGKVVAKVRVPRSGKYVVKVEYLGDKHTLAGRTSTRMRVG
ncbi:ExeM/NucH family extracellular endonuclease [Nocardioides KLBMP 9356]|uniref:ExeM/NucH family extracellular endonuclease n=1 Tax=Nocardioides potassii TaxID=2911371 RepID=A0ABS9HD20_9ACTN|nr:ExeM/NucH family extracellular endonuclease [Nocardioides potassii]MCF6379046.1 ExeM/NucH family extracellular endonuclease [Nocardioides potassii]